MPAVNWARPAADDLDATEAYLGGIDPHLARDITKPTIATTQRLIDFPRIGSPLDDDRRSLHVAKTPYLIVYRVRDTIEILRIRHEREGRRG